MRRWQFRVEVTEERGGFVVRVAGTAPVARRGPFPRADDAHLAVWRLVRRWQARARALGGHVWLPEGGLVGVALPDDVPVRHGVPFAHAPCSVVPPVPVASRGQSRREGVGKRGEPPDNAEQRTLDLVPPAGPAGGPIDG